MQVIDVQAILRMTELALRAAARLFRALIEKRWSKRCAARFAVTTEWSTNLVGLCSRANGDLGEMSQRPAGWLHRLQSSWNRRSTGMSTEAEAQRAR